jgi:hypothetical protein
MRATRRVFTFFIAAALAASAFILLDREVYLDRRLLPVALAAFALFVIDVLVCAVAGFRLAFSNPWIETLPTKTAAGFRFFLDAYWKGTGWAKLGWMVKSIPTFARQGYGLVEKASGLSPVAVTSIKKYLRSWKIAEAAAEFKRFDAMYTDLHSRAAMSHCELAADLALKNGDLEEAEGVVVLCEGILEDAARYGAYAEAATLLEVGEYSEAREVVEQARERADADRNVKQRESELGALERRIRELPSSSSQDELLARLAALGRLKRYGDKEVFNRRFSELDRELKVAELAASAKAHAPAVAVLDVRHQIR